MPLFIKEIYQIRVNIISKKYDLGGWPHERYTEICY